VRFPDPATAPDEVQALLALDDEARVPLTVDWKGDNTDRNPNTSSTAIDDSSVLAASHGQAIPLAIVPAPLLAHLDALQRHEALFDTETATFPPVPTPSTYDKMRIYATSIDHVPSIVDRLREQGFGVTSEFTRIKEIHDQDTSLALLVQIVTWGVLLFGILTVSIVLIDSTDRKSKTIGIMRIMGVSSPAVSYMVMLRAAFIGVCAAGVAAVFGWAFCSFLSWQPDLDPTKLPSGGPLEMLVRLKPVVIAKLDLWQDRAFLVATVACSILGSLLPAIKVSQLDPFDAVIQSRGG
jgi:ABC-type antimicrobial peptide transport system permease subunit